MASRWWLLVREIKGDEEEPEAISALVYWHTVLRPEVAFRRSPLAGAFSVEALRCFASRPCSLLPALLPKRLQRGHRSVMQVGAAVFPYRKRAADTAHHRDWQAGLMTSDVAGWPRNPCTLLLIWGTNVRFDCFALIFECSESLTFLIFT